VAMQVGFYSPSHFSAVFKRITGLSPGDWRRRTECVDMPAC